MAFQLGDDDTQDIKEMNLIPLIDIMLVLMIIFMVTATVLNPSIPLDLPNTSATVQNQPPKVIQISIDENAAIYWNEQAVSLAQLETRLQERAGEEQAPTIRLRADKDARYETVAQILAIAAKAKLTKISFVSE